MNPFLVFDIDLDTTDEEVTTRYHELIKDFPPDRHPECFSEIRAAYEALKDRRSRLKTWLFGFDDLGRHLAQGLPELVGADERPRIDAAAVAAAMRSLRRGDTHE